MTIHEELARVAPARGTVLTIGTFDSVHLGHRYLLRRVKEMAESGGLLSAVLTFRNHPRPVLNPEVTLNYITTLEERISLIRGQGIDQIIGVNFTTALSLLKAREFVSLLLEHLKVKGLVLGPDFALGHRREGDIPTLKRLGEEMGFWVEPVEPVLMDESVINSSRIRGSITLGDIEYAGRMLGRAYALTGVVVEGARRGRLLGFPTANLSLDSGLIVPGDGIYATWATVEGTRYRSATSIGVRPTFGAGDRTVEAFIMDFQEDLYGKLLTLEFVCRLREELAFSSPEALIEQMKADVDQARSVLSSLPRVLTG